MQIAIAGTNDFVKKSDEFIVNIALIHKETPIHGVVHASYVGSMLLGRKK